MSDNSYWQRGNNASTEWSDDSQRGDPDDSWRRRSHDESQHETWESRHEAWMSRREAWESRDETWESQEKIESCNHSESIRDVWESHDAWKSHDTWESHDAWKSHDTWESHESQSQVFEPHSTRKREPRPQGKRSRSNRTAERHEQKCANSLRLVCNMDISPRPLSVQIRDEKGLKMRQAVAQKIYPKVLNEKKDWDATVAAYRNALKNNEERLRLGLPALVIVKPQVPWLGVSSSSPSSGQVPGTPPGQPAAPILEFSFFSYALLSRNVTCCSILLYFYKLYLHRRATPSAYTSSSSESVASFSSHAGCVSVCT